MSEPKDLPFYDAATLPPVEDWRWYKKKLKTRAVKITGPFRVETREGTMSCESGWLALDANGSPYPIADDVFESSYEVER